MPVLKEMRVQSAERLQSRREIKSKKIRSSNEGDSVVIDDLISRFFSQRGCWDTEKRAGFEKWDATALAIIIGGLDVDDAALVDELETAFTLW